MTELVQSVWPNVTRVHLIFATFVTFVVLILLFAILYYRLYRHGAARFWIASDIAAKQAEDTIARLQLEIAVLTTESDAIAEVRSALADGSIGGVPAVLPSGRRVDGGAYQGRQPDGNADDGVWLNVIAGNGSVLCRLEEYEYHELNRSYLADWLGEALSQRLTRRDDRRRRILELEAQPQSSLRFWDLVYFSGVTQTTVGYGDILPNATGIRMLVLSQVLFGYAVLIVLLNLVLTG